MTAAVSPSTALARASTSLKGTCRNPGTRGSNGSRNSRRQVALSAPIVRPWNPRIAATIPGRPVAARANLIAASTASEPELLRKTRFRFRGATESNFDEGRFRIGPERRADVDELLGLTRNGLDDRGVAVAEISDAEGGPAIDVLLARLVP